METLSILSTFLIVSSCAFHSGTITSNTTEEPVVHKDIAVGVSEANVVLGIGGLSKNALISTARKNMILSRPLENDEQYNNIEVNIKRNYYLFGLKTKVVINADVIEPKDSVTQASYSEEYLNQIKTKDLEVVMFSVGDSVYINNYNYQSGKILRFIKSDSKSKIELSFIDPKGVAKTKVVNPNKVFIIKDEHMGLKAW
jgi:hypothetical protein